MIKLYNGDCLEVMKGINEDKAIIVTDPPFNIGYKYNKYKDNLKEEKYLRNLTNILSSRIFVLVHYPESLYKILFNIGVLPEKIVSWVYNSNTKKQHRDIAFCGIKPDFSKVKQPYKNLNDKRIKQLIVNGSAGTNIYDWWEVQQVKNISKEKTAHPCQMPLKIMKNIIGLLPEDYTIIDPFMGSGTTGVACQHLNRNFIGIELDEGYFEIAKQRIEQAHETKELF